MRKGDRARERAEAMVLATWADLPSDLTERWFGFYNEQKFTARGRGDKPPMHGLTMVEAIVLWWEEDVRSEWLVSQSSETK